MTAEPLGGILLARHGETDDNVEPLRAQGEKVYGEYCAGCHGHNGRDFAGGAVRDDRGDGTERLDLVRLGAVGVIAEQHHRRHERAPLRVRVDRIDRHRVSVHET